MTRVGGRSGIPGGGEAGSASPIVLVAGLIVLLGAVGGIAYMAGRPVDPPGPAGADGLQGEIRELRSETARLAAEVANLGHRLEVLESERGAPMAAAPVARSESPPEDAGEPAPVDPEADVGDESKAAIEKTVKEVMQERERSRFARMMGIDLDAFAEEADLTEDQRKRLGELLGKYQDTVRDRFRSMRRGPPASEEEREARRSEMTTALEEVRGEVLREAGTFLEPAQLATFEEQLRTSVPGRGMGGGPFGR